MRRIAGFLLLCFVACAQTPVESLRANLRYLASDELEGRGTPSHGLDLAADYIAKQFQEIGLEPAAQGGSYFQVANFKQVRGNPEGFALTFKAGPEQVAVTADQARVRSLVALDLVDQPVIALPENGVLPPVEGKVVAGDAARYGTEEFLDLLQSRHPALIILVSQGRPFRGGPRPFLQDADLPLAPVVRINSAEAAEFLKKKTGVTISLHASAPSITDAPLRNVAGILPGSDPSLRAQYVILSAHYDHLGKTAEGIFHGANDNGSGTVSVIEIARELSASKVHPKRSILFMTFFGEEAGLLGSYYYTRHPLVPLKNTVADINLEQMGRTDDNSGPKVNAFTITGPSFSNLPAVLGEAAKKEGIGTYRPSDIDGFFNRSDNYAFALRGVVDTTIAVAVDFPGYHGLGDTIDKIDFDNMAKVDRAVAAGVLRLADESGRPKWSEEKAARDFRDAAAK